MPFYPALPEYRPSTVTPMSALTAGLGAGTELTGAFQNQAIKREALQEHKQRMEAQKQFAQTGDPAALMASAPDMYLRMTEDQRKATDYAMEDAQRTLAMTPPENYAAMRQNLIQRHGSKNPQLGQTMDLMLPKPGATAADLKAFSTRMGDLQGEMKAKAQGLIYKEETGALQERHRTITEKEQATAQKYRMQLQGQLFDQQKSLQENRQAFEKGQQDRRLAVEEGFKKAQVEGKLQEHLTGSVDAYNRAIDTKALEMKKKAAEAYTGPELTEQERKIDAMVEIAKRDNLKMMKPFFDKANVPFVYNIKDYSRTGPPPGVDPYFDENMAKANALTDPAKRAEMTRKIIAEWNRQDAMTSAAPAAEAPPAAPTPAPAAPPATTPATVPPTSPIAPAATPAPAPKPTPAAPVTMPKTAEEYGKLSPKSKEEIRKQRIIAETGGSVDVRGGGGIDWLYDKIKKRMDESEEEQRKRDLEFIRKSAGR